MSPTRIVITGMGAVTGFGFSGSPCGKECWPASIAFGHGNRKASKRVRSPCVTQRPWIWA